MASLSKEQRQKINNECQNEWELDVHYFLFHNEKTLIKKIQKDDKHFLEFTLYFNSQNQISLRINKYEHESGTSHAKTHGLGKYKVLDETMHKRKNVNKLIEVTGDLNNEKLLEINDNTDVAKGYGLIVESDKF